MKIKNTAPKNQFILNRLFLFLAVGAASLHARTVVLTEDASADADYRVSNASIQTSDMLNYTNNEGSGSTIVNYIGDIVSTNQHDFQSALKFTLPATSSVLSTAQLHIKVIDKSNAPTAVVKLTDNNSWHQTDDGTSSFPTLVNPTTLLTGYSIPSTGNLALNLDATSLAGKMGSIISLVVSCGNATFGSNTYFNFVADDDAISNSGSSANNAYLALTFKPQVQSVSVPPNNIYKVGDALNFTVSFDSLVNVTGTPKLSLALNTGTVQASYVGGSGSQNLVFRYTVAAGDADADGVTVGALALNGGTIRSDNSDDAELTLYSVGATTGVIVALAPTVTTQAVSSIASTTATGNGNITSLGVPSPTAYGVCWNTTGTPTTSDSKVNNGAALATGAFTAAMASLSANTTYHVRAYATNTAGTSYGTEVTFTSAIAPTVTTQAASSITSTTATGNGNITSLGVPSPTAYGICWNTTGTPTTSDSKVDNGAASATGAFTAAMTGLTVGTAYHVRAYATNTAGTSYGTEVTFTTDKQAQTITFADPGVQYFGTTPTLPATASSGLTVTFTSSTTDVCTITSGGALTTVSTGTCTINADQEGNAAYLASTASHSFTVAAVAPSAPTIGTATAGDAQATVSFTAPTFTGGASITGYTVTSSPGGITGTGTISPITVTGLTNGTAYTFAVTATNGVDPSTASAVSNSVTPQGSQTITFADPGVQYFGMTPTLPATASSGLTVTFTSSTTDVCTITSGGALTIVTPGTCTINADQEGNAAYLASTASHSFTVAAVAPSAPTIGTATAGDAQATVSFTAPTFTGGASITGYTVTSSPGGITGTGTTSPITVAGLINGTAYTFAVTATNSAGTSVVASTASNSVTPQGSQTITFADPGTLNLGMTPTFIATSTSGLTVTFSSSTTDVCTITSGGVLTMVTTGTCTISADQVGNAAFTAAPTVSRSFAISQSDALSIRPATKVVSHDLGANIGHAFAFVTQGSGAARLGPSSCTGVNSCLSVEVVLPEAASVSVSVFDNLGTPVITFDQSVSKQDFGNLAATGDGRWILPVSWNLRSSGGAPVPSGVYMWKIVVVTEGGQKLETVKRLGVR